MRYHALLLIPLMLLLSVGCRDAGLEDSREQEQVIAALEKLDARITRAKDRASRPILIVDLCRTHVCDNDLSPLVKLPHLARLDLGSTNITDAGLIHLANLMELQYLDLDNTRVTDAGLRHLKRLSQLRLLVLAQTSVTDTGVSELHSALPHLQIFRGDPG
jgi:Leucine Rich repeat